MTCSISLKHIMCCLYIIRLTTLSVSKFIMDVFIASVFTKVNNIYVICFWEFPFNMEGTLLGNMSW